MQIFLTVVAGVGVFVFGQIVVKFFVEPWHAYRDCIGRIAHALVLYGQAHNDERFISFVPVDEARREIVSLSGELLQRTYAIPAYGLFARFPGIASWEEIRTASVNLRALGSAMEGVGGIRKDCISDIRRALRLFDPSDTISVRSTLWHLLRKARQ